LHSVTGKSKKTVPRFNPLFQTDYAQKIFMMSTTDQVSKLSELSKTYLATQVTFLKLVIIEKSSKIGSFFLGSVLLIFILALIALFGGFAFSFWYAESFGSLFTGLMITLAFYAFTGILVLVFRKRLFRNLMVRRISDILFFEENEEEDEEDEKTT